MRCFKEKELTLFYYRELKEKRLKFIENHLKECLRCSQKYETLKSFFLQLAPKRMQLKSEDIENMLQSAKAQIHKVCFRINVRERINQFLENIRWGLFYRPRLTIAGAVLIMLLAILPWAGRREHNLNRDFDILQIEIELSLDDAGESAFEIYEENLLPML